MSRRSSSGSSSSSSSSSSSGSPDRSREPSTTPFEPPPQLLGQYQVLLSSTFDLTGLIPTHPLHDEEDEGSRTMTKAEKQNAKKKRRKEREREARLAESRGGASAVPVTSIGFRLFSSCPIRSVHLEDEKVEYPCPPNPRHRELTETEKSLRTQRAESSAVEYPKLGGPSILAERWSRASTHPRELVTANPLGDKGLVVLNISSDVSNTPTRARSSSKSRKIPLLEVQSPAPRKAGVRRGRSKRKVDRPQPGYWRPASGLGGKSHSTLWGYEVGMPFRNR